MFSTDFRMSRKNKQIVLCTIVGVVCFFLGIGAASAHGGRLSKDGCHNHRASGGLHWHKEDTSEAGGSCERAGKVTVKYVTKVELIEVRDPVDPVEPELKLVIECPKEPVPRETPACKQLRVDFEKRVRTAASWKVTDYKNEYDKKRKAIGCAR